MTLRVLFTCGREPEYPRNSVMRAALGCCFDVTEVTDNSLSLPVRYARIIPRLLRCSFNDYDMVFVGFLGQPLMPLIHLLTPSPILFDAFLSIYDTLCFDRRVFL